LRLKLSLIAQSNSVTINYNYQLSAAVYNLLRFGSPEFSSFLHDIGFNCNGKKYKLFSFALRFERIKISNQEIELLSPNAYLHITSPLIDDFIKNVVIGTFENQKIEIHGNYKTSKFNIHQVEALPEIEFTGENKFSLLSPLILSTKKEYNGSLKQYFLRFTDTNDINRILTQNLKNKYSIIHERESKSGLLSLEWDQEYVNRKPRISKKITIDQNGEYPIDLIGIQAPFTVKGDAELIKIGYECGFGEKNSMGFGMAEVIY